MIVELGWVGITTEAYITARFYDLTKEGPFGEKYHIFSFLKKKHNFLMVRTHLIPRLMSNLLEN